MTDQERAEYEAMSTERLKRKADQAWESAGLARMDKDRADETRWTNLALELDKIIGERRYG